MAHPQRRLVCVKADGLSPGSHHLPQLTHILLDEAICGVANQKDRHTVACSGRVGAQELICKWLQPAARVEELPVLLGPDRLVEHLRSPSRVHRSVIILLCHQENQA